MVTRRILCAFFISMAMLSVLLLCSTVADADEQLAFPPTSFSPFGPEGAGSFAFPTGVAVNEATGEVFVADSNSPNVVDIFGHEGGSRLSSIEGTGSESFSFGHEVAGLAIDNSCYLHVPKLTGSACTSFDPSDEDLYVSDVLHSVVDKFKRTGTGEYTYECQFSGWYGKEAEACPVGGGTHVEEERFHEPLGVAVDSQGDVYVADFGQGPGTGAIDEFDPTGKGILEIAEAGRTALTGHPKYLFINSNGTIFALNYTEGNAIAELQRASFTGGVIKERKFSPNVVAIAGDPTTNDLYVDNGVEIERYVPSGPEEFRLEGDFGKSTLGNFEGLAVDAGAHRIYVSDTRHDNAYAFEEKYVTVPNINGGCTSSGVTTAGAKLEGEVNPLETAGASFAFEYGITPTPYESATPSEPAGGGTSFKAVTSEVSGLEPGTLYHCRVDATDTEALGAEVVGHGPDGTFETLPLPPAVAEPAATASDISSEGAILSGSVTPGSSPVNPGNDAVADAHFEIGPEKGSYTQMLPSFAAGFGLEPVAVDQAVPAGILKPGTEYHFALVVSNVAGTVVGPDETFTTAPAAIPSGGSAPLAFTGPAERAGLNSATVTGVVVPDGLPTLYKFEVDTTPYALHEPSHGTVIFGGEALGGRGEVPVSQLLENLQPGVIYYDRLVAFNVDGVSEGVSSVFTTAPPPPGTAQPSTLPILPTPVFPGVKNPITKPTGKHGGKVRKKHHHKKPKAHGKSKKPKRK
jgi:hypothetical protein